MSKRFADVASYPLTWPVGFPRTKIRASGRFKTSLYAALENVQEELRRFANDSGKKLTDVVISSNFTLSDQRPKDSGVAVYFTWDGEETCIPVDSYQKIEDNLQAIFKCIEAKRTMLRHGGINLVKAAFRGYAALPDPASMDWKQVLGVGDGDDLDTIKREGRRLAARFHPDKPTGDPEMFRQVTEALETAKREYSRAP